MSRTSVKYKNELQFYLPGLLAGKYTLEQASRSTGYSVRWLSQLKKRYAASGPACLEHGNKNKIPHNKTSEALKNKILALYADRYSGINFRYFCDCLQEYEGIKINYTTLRNLFKEAEIRSPEAHKIKKRVSVHRPRFRRNNEGDLLQLDGTPYQWFEGDSQYYDLMGSIDDATGKITGLYMSKNECFYGYCEVMRQTLKNYGRPREVYTDRAAIFCVTPKNKKNLTVWEQLAGIHDKKTQWQRVLEDLNIHQILAWSPQAKGRVERMWGTVQKRLPFWFKQHGIKTMEQANIALPKFVRYFNEHFAKEAKSPLTFWTPAPANLDDIMCAQITRLSDSNGCFSFHSYKFAIKNCNRCACRTFTLCLSERGIFARLDGLYYPVEILEDIYDVIGDKMPQVVKDICYRYLYADQKQVSE